MDGKKRIFEHPAFFVPAVMFGALFAAPPTMTLFLWWAEFWRGFWL